MSMTIKQLAETVGVSKTAIRKKMDANFRALYTKTDDVGTIIITDEGCELITQSFRKLPETAQTVAENTANKFPETPKTDVSAELVKMLQAQLDAKDRQIDELNARLAETTAALTETTKSLQAAQALHAGTIQQQLLDEPHSEKSDTIRQDDEPKKQGFWRRVFHGKKD